MFGSVCRHSVPSRKRCNTGLFRQSNALLPDSEPRVDFFETNACNLPKYTVEHVWECFWAFGSGTKNDAKRVHLGTRIRFCRVAKLGGFFATNACNLPKYTLEHVWECFWAFGSGTKNDAKQIGIGTRRHSYRVAKLGGIFAQRTHAILQNIQQQMYESDCARDDRS